MTTTTELPVFVYGTLRPHQPNARIWEGDARPHCDGLVLLPGYRLVTHGAFPYALPAEGHWATGCLLYPDPYKYDTVLQRLDWLEGYPHHYDRKVVTVEIPTDPDSPDERLAWVYTPKDPAPYENLTQVELDDWSQSGRYRAIAGMFDAVFGGDK